MTPLHPIALYSAGQERKKRKSDQGSGCGGLRDRAQTMAEWDPQQYIRIEMNGDLTAAIKPPDVWRSLMLNCGGSVFRLVW